MKKIIFATSFFTLPLVLIGCGTVNNVERAGGSVVSTGVGAIAATGSAVGTTINKGVGFLTGQPATSQDMKTYHHDGVVSHNGHKYKIRNGKYVLIK